MLLLIIILVSIVLILFAVLFVINHFIRKGTKDISFTKQETSKNIDEHTFENVSYSISELNKKVEQNNSEIVSLKNELTNLINEVRTLSNKENDKPILKEKPYTTRLPRIEQPFKKSDKKMSGIVKEWRENLVEERLIINPEKTLDF